MEVALQTRCNLSVLTMERHGDEDDQDRRASRDAAPHVYRRETCAGGLVILISFALLSESDGRICDSRRPGCHHQIPSRVLMYTHKLAA